MWYNCFVSLFNLFLASIVSFNIFFVDFLKLNHNKRVWFAQKHLDKGKNSITCVTFSKSNCHYALSLHLPYFPDELYFIAFECRPKSLLGNVVLNLWKCVSYKNVLIYLRMLFESLSSISFVYFT